MHLPLAPVVSLPGARGRRRPSARAWVSLAATLLLAALPACGGKDGGRGGAGAVSTKDPESIPLRTVFVTIHPGGDPKLPALRTKEQALARAKEAQAKAMAPGASFAAVATEMSDDPISAADEGFATFVAPWTKEAPEILKAAQALAVGGISDPVETPFGYHVLQRLSREEGKALENQHCAAVEGFLVQWHDLVPSLPETQTKDQAYAEAAKACEELKAKKITSTEAQARIAGAVPFDTGIRKKSIPGFEALAAVALKTPVGQWTDPIETLRGWAVVERRPYLRAYVRHILVSHKLSQAPVPRTDRLPQDARTRAAEALALLQKDASAWDEVVEKYSDEASTKSSHGFIGEAVSTDSLGRRMAMELLEGISEIPPGQIDKELITSRYGYHIVWRRD